MKKITLVASGLVLSLAALAQEPVHFAYRAEKVDDKTCTIHITASIDEGWHIYSQNQPKEAISQPTKIIINKSPLFSIGKPMETGKKEKYEDKVAGIIQYQYGGTVDFVETLTLKAPIKTSISGNITYQACTEEMCLPPKTIPFTVSIP
jgi:DsbC/DsbD-like thiol-disulfide interchange protein